MKSWTRKGDDKHWDLKKNNNNKRENILKPTFVLDWLALAGWGPFSYGSTDEKYEFLNARTLEIPEMTHIHRVC